MSHPYISGAGSVGTMIDQLRKAFPQTVDSGTVSKLGLAPKNESYVINALQFIGAIDENGKKTEKASEVFSLHNNEAFQSAFEEMIESSYSDLFELHGDSAWGLSKSELITFFRSADQTSEVIGGRQASLFQVLANRAGKLDGLPTQRSKTSSKTTRKSPNRNKPAVKDAPTREEKAQPRISEKQTDFGLSVRVEINLPSDADAETYDNIFKSIKKNLMP